MGRSNLGHRLELLGLDRQQHHLGSPGTRRIGAHSAGQLSGKPLGGSGVGHHGLHRSCIELAERKPGAQQSLGHAAQADHPEGRAHRALAISCRPQAGLGAASWDSARLLAGWLTMVGEAGSSVALVVTVTQLGANRKMLSPTRS